MGYYEILMESLEYLAKSGNVFSDFSRTDDHFLHGRDSVCKKSKKIIKKLKKKKDFSVSCVYIIEE